MLTPIKFPGSGSPELCLQEVPEMKIDFQEDRKLRKISLEDRKLKNITHKGRKQTQFLQSIKTINSVRENVKYPFNM